MVMKRSGSFLSFALFGLMVELLFLLFTGLPLNFSLLIFVMTGFAVFRFFTDFTNSTELARNAREAYIRFSAVHLTYFSLLSAFGLMVLHWFVFGFDAWIGLSKGFVSVLLSWILFDALRQLGNIVSSRMHASVLIEEEVKLNA
jgi:hypothetical protein